MIRVGLAAAGVGISRERVDDYRYDCVLMVSGEQ